MKIEITFSLDHCVFERVSCQCDLPGRGGVLQ